MKKDKRIQPNILEKGCEVIVRTSVPANAPPLRKGVLPPILTRPARIIGESNGGYDVEYTDGEGGVGRGIPSDVIQPVMEFNIETPKS